MTPYALIGPLAARQEFLKGSNAPEPDYQGELPPPRHDIEEYSLIIDLGLDESSERLSLYAHRPGQIVLASAVKYALHEIAYQQGIPIKGAFLGLNALPTFLDRPVWELSLYDEAYVQQAQEVAAFLGVEIQIVPDQVGMVTPRTVFMVINEAYQVIQEGTATEADIDLAMKLGTNYPRGPIAWSREIGLPHIVETIDRLREYTGESRYKVTPLLRRMMMLE